MSDDLARLADSLSLLADQLHRRILRAIRGNHLASGRENDVFPFTQLAISLPDAQALYQDEMMLRQRANRLYAEAANYTGSGLDVLANELTALTHAASVKIHQINTLKELVDLSTHLLALANAALSAKPEQMITAAERLRADLQALRKENLAATVP